MQRIGGRVAAWIAGHYTRQGLWSLFLMCAFPLHAWTLILAFRDVSWVTERTNAWDAVGVVFYGVVFAFLESLALFSVMVLLGYLVSAYWEPPRRVVLLAVLVLVAALWAVLEQSFFLADRGLPAWLIGLLVRSGHPARALYALAVSLVGLTVLAPVVMVLRFERAYRLMQSLMDRLSVLTMFYLALDALGLVIVILRNL